MITVDFIGILITSCMVGIRYPAYLLLTILFHELGRIILAIFFQGQIDSIVVAGVFSATSVSHLSSELKALFVSLGGPIANYVVSLTIGGVEWEKTSHLINPFSILRHPIAVINFRFAVGSFFVSVVRYFFMEV